jgi:hypothetical protein
MIEASQLVVISPNSPRRIRRMGWVQWQVFKFWDSMGHFVKDSVKQNLLMSWKKGLVGTYVPWISKPDDNPMIWRAGWSSGPPRILSAARIATELREIVPSIETGFECAYERCRPMIVLMEVFPLLARWPGHVKTPCELHLGCLFVSSHRLFVRNY